MIHHGILGFGQWPRWQTAVIAGLLSPQDIRYWDGQANDVRLKVADVATFWFFASQERLSTNTLARLWEKDNFIPRKCPVARGSKIQEGEEGKEKIKLLNNEYNQAGAGSMFSAGRICTRTDDMQLHNPRGGLRDVMRRERGIEREMITFLSWEGALLLSFVCEIGRGFAAFAAQESVSSLVFFREHS